MDNDALDSVDQFQGAVIAIPDRLGGLAQPRSRMALAADTRAVAVASLLCITRTRTLSAVLVWLRASERISVSDLAIWARTHQSVLVGQRLIGVRLQRTMD